MSSTEMKALIEIHGDHGYVWDADAALWLRETCGIVGAMVGGVAGFKQQNAVHGLPLHLCPEEVTLCLQRGWGDASGPRPLPVLLSPGHTGSTGGGAVTSGALPPTSTEPVAEHLDLIPSARATAAESAPTTGGPGGGAGSAEDDYESDPYASSSDEDEGVGAVAGAARPPPPPPPQPASPPRPWRDALLEGAAFTVPSGAEAAAALSGCSGTPPPPPPPAPWTYPRTSGQRARTLIFADLHARGYRLTGGSKFGADFLVYPGDPTLYHAQFTLRCIPPDECLVPSALAAACRGSHQARKHLVIASVDGLESDLRPGARARAAAAAAAAATMGGPDDFAAAAEAGEGGARKRKLACLEGEGEESPLECRGGHRIVYTTIGPVEGFG